MDNEIDPDDILVTIDHPHGQLEVPLSEWVRNGPGPRPYVQICRARRRSTGQPVPVSEIDDPWRRTERPTYPDRTRGTNRTSDAGDAAVCER